MNDFVVTVIRSDGQKWGPVEITERNPDAAARAAIASMQAPREGSVFYAVNVIHLAIHKFHRPVEQTCAECGELWPCPTSRLTRVAKGST